MMTSLQISSRAPSLKNLKIGHRLTKLPRQKKRSLGTEKSQFRLSSQCLFQISSGEFYFPKQTEFFHKTSEMQLSDVHSRLQAWRNIIVVDYRSLSVCVTICVWCFYDCIWLQNQLNASTEAIFQGQAAENPFSAGAPSLTPLESLRRPDLLAGHLPSPWDTSPTMLPKFFGSAQSQGE